jgi:hypothetical protein
MCAASTFDVTMRILKREAARFSQTAAPIKATGGVTPVATRYQKSLGAIYL